MKQPTEYLPHDNNRSRLASFQLNHDKREIRDLFNEVKFALESLIETIERIVGLDLVRNGQARGQSVEDADADVSLSYSDSQVEDQYLRPRVEKACATIHRYLYEARLGLRDLKRDVDNDTITDEDDRLAVSELDSMVLQYKNLYDRSIKPHFFTRARFLTPSLEIFRGGSDKMGLRNDDIPKEDRRYLQDALREFVGMVSEKWVAKKAEYNSSERYSTVFDEYLTVLYHLSQEYNGDADLIALDIDSPGPVRDGDSDVLEYLDAFHEKLAPYVDSSLRGFHLEDVLRDENSYKNFLKPLIAKLPSLNEKKMLDLIRLILILDRLKFYLSSSDGSYIDSKRTKYSLSDDYRLTTDELKEFQQIYEDCVEHLIHDDYEEPLELKEQSLINTKELSSAALEIQEETNTRGFDFTINDPSSRLNSLLQEMALDDGLKEFLDSRNLFEIRKDSALEELVDGLYYNAYNSAISLRDTAKLMILLVLSFGK